MNFVNLCEDSDPSQDWVTLLKIASEHNSPKWKKGDIRNIYYNLLCYGETTAGVPCTGIMLGTPALYLYTGREVTKKIWTHVDIPMRTGGRDAYSGEKRTGRYKISVQVHKKGAIRKT